MAPSSCPVAALSTAAASTSTSTSTSSKQSNTAKLMAQNFEVFQMKKLKEAGVLGVQRPYTIVAESVGTSPEKSMRSTETRKNCITTKIVHFQRHGQGYHNLLGEMVREFYEKPVNLDDKDPKKNPFIRPEILDSPLTEKGRLECAARRPQASLLNPQAVIVSPLHRAIQTAMLSFADHYHHHAATTTKDCCIPWIAHEGAREQMGLLTCNKRRALSQTRAEFPHIDFSQMDEGGDEDTLWDPHARESPQEETERIYKFLTEFLMDRPEDELALVGHSAWLFTMCNAVVDCGDDQALRSLFLTSEIRSMRLSFYKTKDFEEAQ